MLFLAYALGALILGMQAIWPFQIPVLPFVPFAALCALIRPFHRAILLSALGGFAADLLSSDPFGLHALSYCCAAAITFRLRYLFSHEQPMQLAVFSGLVSLCATTIQIALLFLFDRRIPFCGRWWMIDWPQLPIFDALYALIWFAGPLRLYQLLRKRWTLYWIKKNNPSPT